MPIIVDKQFDTEMNVLVEDVTKKLGLMAQTFLIRMLEKQPKRELKTSEINQNILLAVLQFESHLTDLTISSMAFATQQMEDLFHKRFHN